MRLLDHTPTRVDTVIVLLTAISPGVMHQAVWPTATGAIVTRPHVATSSDWSHCIDRATRNTLRSACWESMG